MKSINEKAAVYCLFVIILFILDAFARINYTVPQQAILKYGKSESLVPGAIYPIGWSRTGRFAYIREQEQDAAGFTEFTLVVQNMITDAVIASFTAQDFDNIIQFWSNKSEHFSQILNEHGIVQHQKFKLMTFPLTHGKDTINVELRHSEQLPEKTDNLPIMGSVYLIPTQVQAIIESKLHGKKQVYSEKFSIKVKVSVAGYLKNPYEDRIALVLRYETPGQHGTPPHYVHNVFVGVHLEKGF